ncbi:FliA/WhiG family RNA polymerase sigma factor [Pelotomaculum terephthalicicum JT]|uniref:FliA/WhiG family RNA polymerase sigma factor n=1 Tax=Pelotomaculum TaxID=191373 RepID=UPI0009D4F37A|nr:MULTISPECIES: FliA/WhiG family RNA polymerase sigma factor [Pelotomaculum]MCG9967962.1 FliA/WhiG family RNA polymerase sigma factor [Pelotomaculum terephthalicicum JT]OPX88562.1 MAG: RNA polymerase sigma factor FliA [Pelotomaculum sp. PtaB.Bin117]OPY63065.1 MAG: RNA polymerase sigma factor FliA [Pelotomaculum sp. PtaU1.Bin065]
MEMGDDMAVNEELWREYHTTREKSIKHELVMEHLPLVKHLAGRLAVRLPAVIDQEDLESYGVFGLLEAVDKFNPDLGTSFKAFAYSRIRGAMIDEIRKLNWVPRTVWQRIQHLNATREKLQKEHGDNVSGEMLAEAMGVSLSELHRLAGQTNLLSLSSLDEITPGTEGETVRLVDLIRDPASPDPLDIVEKKEGRRLLAEAIGQLNEKDQLVLSLYYQEKLTLKEISKVLEVSESRVCQLHTRAIDRLRKKLEQVSYLTV